MTVIGLTGNSGTGKSSVAKVMEKYGALILDCDKIAHENMAVGGCAYDKIVSAFGKAYAEMVYEECLEELFRRESPLLKEVLV